MKKFIIVFAALFVSMAVSSQTLPNKCKVGKPASLHKSTIFIKDTKDLKKNGYGKNNQTTNYWDVYSDRCDNVAYKSASISSGESAKLKFNQKVRIADVSNDFALVYLENNPGGVNFPQISSDIRVLGWVPMDNLLLWDSCPTDEFGIYRKALIVRNLDQQKDEAFGRISQRPELSQANSSNSTNLKSSTDFHYIMKEYGTGDNTRYLIAKYNKLDGTTDHVIEGWVSKNSFSPWNQRSCLEPNWNADDVKFFVDNKKKAYVYNDAAMVDTIQPWRFGQTNSEGQLSTQYRMPPRAMRFPILDSEDKSGNSFRVTAFGQANGELGQQMVDMDDGKEKREEHLKKAAHINVIVVMDGTRSMKPYFETMSLAVQDVSNYLQGKEVSVGAVIYRDYTDGDQNVIEYHKMSPAGDSGVLSFLQNIGRNGYGASSSKADLTAYEAMYLGLKTALDYNKMGYSPDNSNLVFIVGDCGNDPKDNTIRQQSIIDMCKKADVQLFSFQVLNQDKPAWNDFNSQLIDIFDEYMKYQYTSSNSNVTIRWRPVKHGLGVTSNSVDHFYSAEVRRGQVGVELQSAELKQMIDESYTTFRKVVDERLATLENIGSIGVMINDGSDATGVKGTSIKQDFLRKKLGADYDAIVKANSLLAYSGYAKKDDGLGHDYWQAVVFLSSEELVDLIKKLEPLKIAAKTNSYTTADRANYVKAVAGIIQSMTERPVEEIEQLTTEDITRIIGGLNVSTPMLKGKQSDKVYTLSEIKNSNACPDEEFKKILKLMSSKIEDLSALPRSSNFKYSFIQNGVKSYWVPLSMIP